MSDPTVPSNFEFNLGDYGGAISIPSPDELRKWVADEWKSWIWITTTGQSHMDNVVRHHQQFAQRVNQYAGNWASVLGRPDQVERVLNELSNLFQEYYCKRLIFHSSSIEAAFLSQLREKSKETVAAGAYAALLGGLLAGSLNDTPFLEGIFEGFIYKRNIDWTGSANAEVFNQLKKRYETNTAEQDRTFKELQAQNTNLNTAFGDTLRARTSALQTLENDQVNSFDKLHEEQSTAFTTVIKKHEENLKAIEQTYDQKLALQKPVEYWDIKERIHKQQARNYGAAALGTMLVLVGILGVSIYNVLSGLKSNEDPKHWQVGLLLAALFFSIWLMRILVRLFLSHLHLAGDAAERRTMILTYLAIGREGTQFAPQDKSLILQHLFRSASDGLVKDDGAPPTPMEFLTRK